MMSYNVPFFQRNRRLWVGIVVLLISSLVVILVVQAIASSHAQTPANGSSGNLSDTGPQSFSVGSDAQLIVKEQSGNISVFPSSGNTISVEPRSHGTLVAPNPQN